MAEAKTAAAPSKPKKEPTKKGNIAKEIIFAILFFLSFLLVWIGISIKFNPESAKDLLFYSDKSYLVLFLSAGLLGITTAFVGMYIQRYWLIAIALGLSIISYFFFLPFGIFSLIILIILFATGTAAFFWMKHERKVRIKLSSRLIVKHGLPAIFTVLALLVAVSYYTISTKEVTSEDDIITAETMGAAEPVINYMVKMSFGSYELDKTAGDLMVSMVFPAKKEAKKNEQLDDFRKSIKAQLKKKGYKENATGLKKAIQKDEDIKKVMYDGIVQPANQPKVKDFFEITPLELFTQSYAIQYNKLVKKTPQYVFAAVAILLFIGFKLATFVVKWIVYLLNWILFLIFKGTKLVKVEKVTTEMENITL